MKTFETIMKYILYVIGIIIGIPFLAWVVITCLSMGLANPIFIVCIIILIIIAIKILQNTKSKKMQKENEQPKEKVKELKRQIEIERMVKNSDRGTKHE